MSSCARSDSWIVTVRGRASGDGVQEGVSRKSIQCLYVVNANAVCADRCRCSYEGQEEGGVRAELNAVMFKEGWAKDGCT